MNTIDGDQTGEMMDKSGAHDTRRGARRLARFPPGSGAEAKSMSPRVWNIMAPGRLVDTTPGIDRGKELAAKGTKKTAAPVRGRAVSSSWYHPTSRPHRKRPPQSARRDDARCGSSITGADSPFRAPAAAYQGRLASCLFGAELEGLFRRHFRSRFAATAVLLPVPAGYSSASLLRYSLVDAP
jgi:hypothetical protein